jgi:hypothetical protein
MAAHIVFRNIASGEVKTVKEGWSWTLSLFGTILGIPLWMRKVYPQAATLVVWDILCVVLPESYDWMVTIFGLAICVLLGLRGNKMTAEYYLKHGWELADPDAEDTIRAMQNWAL